MAEDRKQFLGMTVKERAALAGLVDAFDEDARMAQNEIENPPPLSRPNRGFTMLLSTEPNE